jgi:hypothetical protein
MICTMSGRPPVVVGRAIRQTNSEARRLRGFAVNVAGRRDRRSRRCLRGLLPPLGDFCCNGARLRGLGRILRLDQGLPPSACKVLFELLWLFVTPASFILKPLSTLVLCGNPACRFGSDSRRRRLQSLGVPPAAQRRGGPRRRSTVLFPRWRARARAISMAPAVTPVRTSRPPARAPSDRRANEYRRTNARRARIENPMPDSNVRVRSTSAPTRSINI